MLRLALVLAVLISFHIHPNTGTCVDPNGRPQACNDRGLGLDPSGHTASVNGDKGLGVDPNG